MNDATHPFTRDIADWRVFQPIRTDHKPKSQHHRSRYTNAKELAGPYIPRGDRSTWTRAQYTVYKEEKAYHRERSWGKRKPELREIAKELIEKDAKLNSSVTHGYQHRTVLARVAARGNGEPAPRRDAKGLPKEVTTRASESSDSETDSQNANKADRPVPKIKQKRKLEDNIKPTAKRLKVADGEEGEWTVPPLSDIEDEHDEIAYLARHGCKIVHDFWPSTYRGRVAADVNKYKCSKTVSLSYRNGAVANT